MKIRFGESKIKCRQVMIKRTKSNPMKFILPAGTEFEISGIEFTPCPGSKFKCGSVTIKKTNGMKIVLPAHTQMEIPVIGLITPTEECTIEFLE